MGGEGGEQTAKSATRPQLQRPRASTDRRRRRDGLRPRSPSLPALRPATARAAGVFAANTAREWGGVRRTEGRHAEDDGEKQRREDTTRRGLSRVGPLSRGGVSGALPPAPSASASGPGMRGLRPRPRLSLHSSDRAPRMSDARTAAAARLRSRRRSSRRCGGRRWSCRRRICSGGGARAAATSVSQCVRSEILDAPHVVISLHGRRRSAARGGRPGRAGVARGGPGARAPKALDVRRPGRSRDRRARDVGRPTTPGGSRDRPTAHRATRHPWLALSPRHAAHHHTPDVSRTHSSSRQTNARPDATSDRPRVDLRLLGRLLEVVVDPRRDLVYFHPPQ